MLRIVAFAWFFLTIYGIDMEAVANNLELFNPFARIEIEIDFERENSFVQYSRFIL